MCLNINNKYHSDNIALVAKKDIFTLKMSENTNNKYTYSFYNSVQQPLNKLLRSKFSFVGGSIEKGLHSILSLDFFDSLYQMNYRFDLTRATKREILLCKIPKGSKYFIGIVGDIVSNQLIILEPIIANNTSNIKLTENVTFNEIDRTLLKYAIDICESHGYKIGI